MPAPPDANGHPSRPPLERPLALSEVFAEAIRLYGDRRWAVVGLGAVSAGVFVLARVHEIAWVALMALLVTFGWAVATQLALGASFAEAALATARRAPILLAFTLVATLPLALAVTQVFFVIFAVLWLAVTGFAIPVAVAEDRGEHRGVHELGFRLRRSIELARAEYLHAAGVMAALFLTFVLLAIVLFQALRGFAENGEVAAFAIALGVLAPFFFLGLAVLYFDQSARAVSSRRRP